MYTPLPYKCTHPYLTNVHTPTLQMYTPLPYIRTHPYLTYVHTPTLQMYTFLPYMFRRETRHHQGSFVGL
jgi:hypothetical protein